MCKEKLLEEGTSELSSKSEQDLPRLRLGVGVWREGKGGSLPREGAGKESSTTYLRGQTEAPGQNLEDEIKEG